MGSVGSNPTLTARRHSPSESQWRKANSMSHHLAFLHDFVNERRNLCIRFALSIGVTPFSVNTTRPTKRTCGNG